MIKTRWIVVRWLIGSLLTLLVAVIAMLVLFPGQQTPIALSLATGIGIPSLQARVDALEDKAIHRDPFSAAEKGFLRDLYTCFAKGGKFSYILRQPGQMMQRYLEGTGEDLEVAPSIFIQSRPVQMQMTDIRERIDFDIAQENRLSERYLSPVFYMGDPDVFASQAGLYFGRIIATPQPGEPGGDAIEWSVKMPWQWPTYEQLHQKFGDYHAQCFPIPNARSLLQGSEHCLWIDDGLGEHMAQMGLAKPFLVLSSWQD